jgi:hypothetical protein
VVPAAEFATALETTVEKMLALPTSTVTASKRLTRLAFDLDRDTFRERMNAAFAPLLHTPEHRDAMAVLRKERGWPEEP